MKISIHILLEELEKLGVRSLINFDASFSSYNILEEKVEASDVLYISDVTKFVSINNLSDRKTYILADPLNILNEVEFSEKINVIALKENLSIASITNIVTSIFSKYKELESNVLTMLYLQHNLETILLNIYNKTGLEMFLIDSKGSILFRNSNSYKYYPQSTLTSKTIRDGKKILGSLSLMSSKTLSKNYQLALFSLLVEILNKKLENYFDLKKDAFNDLSKLILESIDGKKEFDEEDAAFYLKTINWSLDDKYKIFLLKSSKFENIQQAIDYINEQYLKDSIIIKHNNKYMVLLNASKAQSDIVTNELKMMFEDKEIKILASSTFKGLTNLTSQYKFLDALHTKIDNEMLDLSYDTIKVILLLIKGMDTRVLYNQEILKLMAQDDDNNGDLLETLFVYLAYERSLVKTAEKLNVHRNTVVYRVSKIEENIELNLDDAMIRFHILITIFLIKGESILKLS